MRSSRNLPYHNAAVLDLDGTLYDNRTLKWRLIWWALRTGCLGYLSRERKARKAMQGVWYGSEEAVYDELYKRIDPEHPEKAQQWYMERYMPEQVNIVRRHCRPMPWVLPRILEKTCEGKKVVLYSDYPFAKEKILALGLDPGLLHLIVDAPSLGGLKPCKESVQQIMDMLGNIPANEVLFVGDRDDCDGASARCVGAMFWLIGGK